MRVAVGIEAMLPKGRIRPAKDKLPVVYVGVPGGVYRVQFGSKKVDFFKDEEILQNCEVIYGSPMIEEKNLRPKEGFEGARCFPCGEMVFRENGKSYKLIMEYLEGEIPLHDHGDKKAIVSEVYLDIEEPFRAEVCAPYEMHQTFAKKTLAVKLEEL